MKMEYIVYHNMKSRYKLQGLQKNKSEILLSIQSIFESLILGISIFTTKLQKLGHFCKKTKQLTIVHLSFNTQKRKKSKSRPTTEGSNDMDN